MARAYNVYQHLVQGIPLSTRASDTTTKTAAALLLITDINGYCRTVQHIYTNVLELVRCKRDEILRLF